MGGLQVQCIIYEIFNTTQFTYVLVAMPVPSAGTMSHGDEVFHLYQGKYLEKVKLLASRMEPFTIYILIGEDPNSIR